MPSSTSPPDDLDEIEAHYGLGGLRQRIESGLTQLDVTPTVELLAPVDDFHVGGRPATLHLLAQLDLHPSDRVLDVGSGLGGPARCIAASTGASVTGVDLTAEYVDVATWLTEQVGLADLVRFFHTSAAEVAALGDTFSAATLIHVGMNIADKRALFDEVAAALAPGATFAIYDLMAVEGATSELDYPMPWATTATTSHVATAGAYQSALEAAGFDVTYVADRAPQTIAAFQQLAQSVQTQSGQKHDGPPPLGLHLVMGPATAAKVANLRAAIENGVVAPTEMLATRH